jgi:hypothetical protein
MKRIVKYAKFHSSVFHPKTGTLGDTLPSPVKTLPDLSMVVEDHLLLVTTRGATIAIPLTNVSHMELAEIEPSEVSSSIAPTIVKMNTKSGVVGKA